MTDRELLDKSREILSAGYGGTSRELAYFVADYLDDSPVTEEALLAMGFERTVREDYCDTYEHGELMGFFYFENDESVTWHYTYDMANTNSIGQLRCLLRGLGVGV